MQGATYDNAHTFHFLQGSVESRNRWLGIAGYTGQMPGSAFVRLHTRPLEALGKRRGHHYGSMNLGAWLDHQHDCLPNFWQPLAHFLAHSSLPAT